MHVDPVTGISAKALAEGYALAPGRDRDDLMDQFLSLPEADNPDAAWLGFCRSRGEKPGAPSRKFKATGPVVPIEDAPPGLVPIVRLGSEWQSWIDHLDKHDRSLADQMRSSRTFMAYVPAKLPRAAADRPTFPRAKVAA